ncbi:MAG: UDP-N-acetylmuramoyl-L-alanine--D-glutamate ligase [Thermoleophilaceae bacterium]|nr:UDP-N-acetylmuramoyl-L-alanine--D-glutamate ligase [Thermoleophilaceae bacterium]
MKGRPPLPEGPYLVVGLARSGAAAVRLLARYGEVRGADAGEPEEAVGLRDVRLALRSDGRELLPGVRTLVKSPGVPGEAPVVREARERGVSVLGELELAWRLLPNELIAVTGTNGKTTTAELLGAIHREAGVPVAVAGNVGTPLSSLVGEIGEDAVVVCEASSFQLEDTLRFAPEAAVLLNLTEDHLDRHGTIEAYLAAKLQAFTHQDDRDVAVVPQGFGRPGEAELVEFGGEGADLELRAGTLLWRGAELMPAGEVRIRGAHNLENAMAAAAVALARGIDPEPVRRALRTFAGVPHRLEEVAEVGGTLYVNDSKATNVGAARVGVEAFAGGVHLILGGSLKGGGFRELREAVSERCAACYLIGEAADRLAADLDGAAPLRRCGDLERALREAAAAARAGEVVLLSPACASFDQYRSYEERGEHFRTLVRELASA